MTRLREAGAALLVAVLVGACASAPTSTTTSAASAAPAAGVRPPAAAAAQATSGYTYTLINPGFESTTVNRKGDPDGWYSFQHAGDKSYDFALDGERPRSGQRSLRIENTGPEPYGAIAQIVEAKPFVGKTARLTGWLRTRDASGLGAGLTLLVLSGGATLDQNFMYDQSVRGTTDWQRFTITIPVKPGADRVEVGAMLRGKGALWLDDVELAFVTP